MNNKRTRQLLPLILHNIARRKLATLNVVKSLEGLAAIRSNALEKLEGKRKDQWSLRINEQYRICFQWAQGDAYKVEIVDYH
ncbi:type II toxin-antitoxin system RelE/ParE family toxin [Oligoflexia bacterium]|nr:type II toxin-antitoxin system RelE/ParE family toxin [Oligoflexia bacterium]